MASVLWAGMAISAILGALHAGYVYRLVVNNNEAGTRIRALYYAVWTFGLWLLLGTYVLMLWVLSVAVYAVARPLRWQM
jgi:hypothetical protein